MLLACNDDEASSRGPRLILGRWLPYASFHFGKCEESRAAAPAWGCEARLGARSYEQQDAAIG